MDAGRASTSSSSSSSTEQVEASRLQAQFARLKTDYKKLKDEHDTFQQEHEKELRKRDVELQKLKRSPESGESEKKIKALENEIQSLLGTLSDKDAEISKLRFQLAGRGSSLGTNNGAEKLRVSHSTLEELAAKNTQIEQLKKMLKDRDRQIERMKYNIVVHNDAVADQLAAAEPKKKKGWFGTSKKSKAQSVQPTFIVTDDLSLPAPSATSDDRRLEPGSVVNVHHLQRLQSKYKKEQDEMEQTMMTLERDKTRLDTKVQALQKDCTHMTEKIDRLEKANTALRAQIQLAAEREPAVFKSAITIPTGPGNEADKWKALAQRQEAALKKLAIKKEQLQLQVKGLTDTFSNRSTSPSISSVRHDGANDLLKERTMELDSMKTVLETTQNKNAELEIAITDLKTRVHKYKSTIADLQKLWDAKTSERKEAVQFLGYMSDVVASNEQLQEKLFLERQNHRESEKLMQGEIRALRQGRAGMFKGGEPHTRVFPSTPCRNITVFRQGFYKPPEPRPVPPLSPGKPKFASLTQHVDIISESVAPSSDPIEEVIPAPPPSPPPPPPPPPPPAPVEQQYPTSESSVKTESDDHDLQAANQTYYYEWVNGGYQLRKGVNPALAKHVEDAEQVESTSSQRAMRMIAEDALRMWNANPPDPKPRALTPPPVRRFRGDDEEYIRRYRRLSEPQKPSGNNPRNDHNSPLPSTQAVEYSTQQPANKSPNVTPSTAAKDHEDILVQDLFDVDLVSKSYQKDVVVPRKESCSISDSAIGLDQFIQTLMNEKTSIPRIAAARRPSPTTTGALGTEWLNSAHVPARPLHTERVWTSPATSVESNSVPVVVDKKVSRPVDEKHSEPAIPLPTFSVPTPLANEKPTSISRDDVASLNLANTNEQPASISRDDVASPNPANTSEQKPPGEEGTLTPQSANTTIRTTNIDSGNIGSPTTDSNRITKDLTLAPEPEVEKPLLENAKRTADAIVPPLEPIDSDNFDSTQFKLDSSPRRPVTFSPADSAFKKPPSTDQFRMFSDRSDDQPPATRTASTHHEDVQGKLSEASSKASSPKKSKGDESPKTKALYEAFGRRFSTSSSLDNDSFRGLIHSSHSSGGSRRLINSDDDERRLVL